METVVLGRAHQLAVQAQRERQRGVGDRVLVRTGHGAEQGTLADDPALAGNEVLCRSQRAHQILGLGRGLGQLDKREFLDLTDPLTGDAVALADGLQGLVGAALQTETPRHDVPVARAERLDKTSDRLRELFDVDQCHTDVRVTIAINTKYVKGQLPLLG